jgi:hypothetical protein
MKTLLDNDCRAALSDRLGRLRPDSERRWGRMTAPQMVCHLTDAFRGVLGERTTSTPMPAPSLIGRTLVRWTALYAPMQWPCGLRTSPAASQEIGGTPPVDFATDLAALVASCDRFVDRIDVFAAPPHFIFGSLTPKEWARWGYLHMDHHLRQFGL